MVTPVVSILTCNVVIRADNRNRRVCVVFIGPWKDIFECTEILFLVDLWRIFVGNPAEVRFCRKTGSCGSPNTCFPTQIILRNFKDFKILRFYGEVSESLVKVKRIKRKKVSK